LTVLAILAKMYKMANTYTISATEFKNKVSDILDDVYFRRKTVIVKRYGKPLVKIVPITDTDNAK